MSTTGTTTVSLGKYLAYLKDIDNASPHTLDLFERTLRACELTAMDTANLSPTWKYLLERFESKKTAWAFVLTAVKIVKAAYKLETGYKIVKDYSYNELAGKLRKYRRDNPNPRVEYTNDDIRLVTRLAWENSRATLFPAFILMGLSGLRVGGCEDVKFSNFRDVEGVPGVKLFLVRSKGSEYDAAISTYGYNLLMATRKHYNRENVVYVPKDNLTAFEDTIRARTRYLLVQKFNQRSMLQDKPILHGFRKWSITQMASSLHKEDVALLAGHKITGSTAFKHYIGKNREKPTPEFEQRIAKAYANTSLMKWRLDPRGLPDSEALKGLEGGLQ